MHVGDRYVIEIAGPWKGAVEVVDVSPRSFRLSTLEGHMESGVIEMRTSANASDGEHADITFTIESWARSRSRVVDLLYDRLRISKETQLHMWTSVLQRVAEVAGGRVTRGIDIHTRRVDQEVLAHV